jgi:hypothetical protein
MEQPPLQNNRFTEELTNLQTSYGEMVTLRGIEALESERRAAYERMMNQLALLSIRVGDLYLEYRSTVRNGERTAPVRFRATTPPYPPPTTVPVSPVAESRSSRRSASVLRLRPHASKVISVRELQAQMPDPCSICYEPYTKANSVTTCCQHSFCSACYASHETAHVSRNPNTQVSCPLCRKKNPKVTEFRSRKPRTKKAEQTTIIDLTDV